MPVFASLIMLILAYLAIVGLSPGLAQSPFPSNQPTRAPNADPKLAAAQAAFEAMPEEERKAIQSDLIWTSDFSGAVSGTFGPLTYRGIQAFKAQAGQLPDGILGTVERKALQEAATKARAAVRFSLRSDSRSKARIGLPQAILTRSEPNILGGTRWQTEDRRITLDTFVSTTETLEEQFARASESTQARKVTYKLLRPDFFVVTGETAGGKFYRRAVKTPLGISGFALGYDKALSSSWDRLTIAIANSFEATPATGPTPASTPVANTPSAALPVATAPTPAANTGQSAVTPTITTRAFEPRVFVRSATGLIVADGKLLVSTSGLTGCRNPRIGNLALGSVISDPTSGLGLASIPGLKVSGQAPVLTKDKAEAVMALAQGERSSAQQGLPAQRELLAVPVSQLAGRLSGAFQPGAAGAVVLDAAGHVAGLLISDPADRLQLAGIVIARDYAMADAEQIGRFLARENVTLITATDTAPVSTGQMVAGTGKLVVAISCNG
jgi:peptidoglycan hydrolase-like protein with peptidoglycan-binding domain